MKTYRYTDETQTIVTVCDEDGVSRMSMLASAVPVGTEILPHVPPAPEPLTPEQLQAMVVQATQQRLDDFARTRNYDGILSACTYATSTVAKFQAEGQYCVAVRDATWAALYALLADVESGERPMPAGFDDVVGALPALEWPA